MLILFDTPVTVKTLESQGGPVELKVAYLHGKDLAIRDVMAERQKDKACRQLPKKGSVDKNYHIRVLYVTKKDGAVFVVRIDVKFNKGWSCFYCPDEHRVGKRHYCDASFTSYYLSKGECVCEPIQKWEDSLAIRRLANLGPEAFPEFEDEDDEVGSQVSDDEEGDLSA